MLLVTPGRERGEGRSGIAQGAYQGATAAETEQIGCRNWRRCRRRRSSVGVQVQASTVG
jgi:hypothetical protein